MATSRRRPKRRMHPDDVCDRIREVLKSGAPMTTREVVAAVGCGRTKARKALGFMKFYRSVQAARVKDEAGMPSWRRTYGGFSWRLAP